MCCLLVHPQPYGDIEERLQMIAIFFNVGRPLMCYASINDQIDILYFEINSF